MLQTRPHAPQLLVVVERSVSQPLNAAPSQSPQPDSQVNPQVPVEHEVAVAWAGRAHGAGAYPRRSLLQSRRSVAEAQS